MIRVPQSGFIVTADKKKNQSGLDINVSADSISVSARSARSLLKFDAIMDSAPVGILFTHNGIMIQANPSFVDMMGYQVHELIGQPASLLFFSIPESHAEIGRVAGPALAAGKPFRGDIQASRQDGSLFWARFSARAVNPASTQDGTLWFLEDVTNEHLRAEKLQRTLEEQKTIFNSAAVGILHSRQRTIARCNAQLARMFGYQMDELLGCSTRIFFRSDEHFSELRRRVYPDLAAGKSFSIEIQIPHRNGQLIWVHATASQVAGTATAGEDVIWIFQNISARKVAEEAKRQTLRELEAVFASAAVGLIYSRDHQVQRCNSRCAEIFGYTPEQLVGQATSVVFSSHNNYRALKAAADFLLRSGQSFDAEFQCRRRDGSLFWCHLYGKALNPDDIGQGTIWIVVDTDEVRRTREQLAASMRDLQALMNNASVGILFTRDRKIIKYNPRLGEMSGYPDAIAVGLPVSVFFRSQEEYETFGVTAFPLIARGQPLQTELYVQHGGGEKQVWVRLIAYPVNPELPGEGTIWLVEDRTAYKDAEQALHKAQSALAQAEKQVALGALVVGVAHELNTPIGNALMAASTLSDRCLDMRNTIAAGSMRRSQLDSYLLDVAGLADLVTRACERAAQLVSSFKQVAVDPAVEHKSVFNLASLIAHTVDLECQKFSDPRWHIDSAIPAEIVCNSYPEPLVQIVVSLIDNALIHAFAGRTGGRIEIAAVSIGQWIELRFSDNGIGMDEAMLARVFDPFFTTRLGLGRSGLGLSITHNLATSVLGGELTVSSQPGLGSCFLLRFPKVAD